MDGPRRQAVVPHRHRHQHGRAFGAIRVPRSRVRSAIEGRLYGHRRQGHLQRQTHPGRGLGRFTRRYQAAAQPHQPVSRQEDDRAPRRGIRQGPLPADLDHQPRPIARRDLEHRRHSQERRPALARPHHRGAAGIRLHSRRFSAGHAGCDGGRQALRGDARRRRHGGAGVPLSAADQSQDRDGALRDLAQEGGLHHPQRPPVPAGGIGEAQLARHRRPRPSRP